MDEATHERRQLFDGRDFLMMSARMPIKLIAGVANIAEAEVLRVIEFAKNDVTGH